jgi:YesN/AraC family two-component response regulator
MPYHILLTDDDADFRRELGDYLEDYRITEAANGEEALAILEKPNDIDLVLLDVMMPGPRGTRILRDIKKLVPNIAVVIITGYSTKDIAIEALKGDADDYVEKPIKINKIKGILERLLEQTRARGDIETGGINGKMERVKHILEVNYHKSISLNDVAEAVCLSPKYLSRVFKEETGTGFNDYKLGIKIGKAKEMLRDSGANVDQIAYSLGYKNPESFIRIFKKLAGCTPTEYREKKNSVKTPA